MKSQTKASRMLLIGYNRSFIFVHLVPKDKIAKSYDIDT